MKITYYDTLYNRVATMIIDDLIYFKQDGESIFFAHMGHLVQLETKNVISIDKV